MGEAKRRKLAGPTGKFPEGIIRPDDKGELQIAISDPDSQGNIHVEFGTAVAWFAMPRGQIVNLARLLLRKAGAKKVEIEF